MGFFDKKYCDICGDKIGLLGNRKLEDGNLCKNCAKKLSPWFDERRHSTVAQIRQQLEYREGNRAKAAAFRTSRTFGRGSTKLYVDDNARKFAVHKGGDFAADNPDILDFSQAVGCDLDIKEYRRELKRTVDGRSVSYNPPRYEYSYDFRVAVHVSHPYFNSMDFDLNGSSVHTGEVCMAVAGNNGAWRVSSAGRRGEDEYRELVQMGNELKAMMDRWKNGGGQGSGAAMPEPELLRFGSQNPVPYKQSVMGSNMVLLIRYFGTAEIDIKDPAIAQRCGSFEELKKNLKKEICMLTDNMIQKCAIENLSFNRLPSRGRDFAEEIMMHAGSSWMTNYGVQLKMLSFSGFTLADESREAYDRMMKSQLGQAAVPVSQPNTPEVSASWQCPFCRAQNAGKFCTNCGAKQP